MAEAKTDEGIQVMVAKYDPHGVRVIYALNFYKLKYSVKEVDISNKPEWFKTAYKKSVGRDPQSEGKSPILRDGNQYITESAGIIRYLDAKYSKQCGISLFPSNPLELAAVESLVSCTVYDMFKSQRFTLLWTEKDKEKIKALHSVLEKQFESLSQRLTDFNAKGPFLLSDNKVSFAEVYLWPMLSRSIAMWETAKGIPIRSEWFKKYPRLASWFNAVKETEWVKQIPYDEKEYVEHAMKWVEAMIAKAEKENQQK